MNLVQMFHSSVVARPNHPCLQAKRDGVYKTWTYQEVWDLVTRLANGLARLGIGHSDKVAILSNNCPEWPVSDFAILSLGAIVVPIYPSLPSTQVDFILQNAEVKWLLAGDSTHLDVAKQTAYTGLEGIILMDGDVPTSTRFQASCQGHHIRTWQQVLDIGGAPSAPPGQSQDVLRIAAYDRIKATDIATIVHTSGTSGTPKGVLLSHENLVTNVRSSLSTLPVYPEDISLSYLPLSHIFERTVGQFSTLAAGATIVYAERIETVRDNILEVQPTLLVTVPRLLEKVYTGVLQKVKSLPSPLSKQIQRDFGQLNAAKRGFSYWLANILVYKKLKAGLGRRMRLIVTGGAGLAPEIAAFYLRAGVFVCEGYGMTESSPVIAANRIADIRPGTVGPPIPGVQVRLAADGELQVKGPNVMQGYYREPESTRVAITADGWLCTGDIATISTDGYIQIVDRKKNILVLATGKNVAPFPIENAITLSPLIADAVLIGDARKYVTCLVVPDFSGLKALISELGLTPKPADDDAATWFAYPAVKAHLTAEIRQAILPFADFEQPKRAYICPAPFRIESGELTPTLKVRTNQILRKYHLQIEAMYDGVDCLFLFDDSAVGAATIASDAESLAPLQAVVVPTVRQQATTHLPARRFRKRRWAVLFTASAIVVTALAMLHPVKLPTALNLLGNIIAIHRNNEHINQTNKDIVSTMQNVSTLSGDTSRIGADLGGLDNGLQAQNENLAQLSTLSQTQVQLSQQLHQLAMGLTGDLNSISKNGRQEATDLGHLDTLLTQIGGTASQIRATNQRIAEKLNTAAQTTHVVAQEMP